MMIRLEGIQILSDGSNAEIRIFLRSAEPALPQPIDRL